MSEISIIVKPTAGGQKFSITGITGATTIAELKEKVRPDLHHTPGNAAQRAVVLHGCSRCRVSHPLPFCRGPEAPVVCAIEQERQSQVQEKTDIAPAEQRLIFKGQVLKDERDVASYGAGCSTAAALGQPVCLCAELV